MEKQQLVEKLYKEHYENLSRYCYFQLKNRHDTEDIVADTFVKAFDHIDSFEGTNYKAWLYTISRNLMYDKFRSKSYKTTISGYQYMDDVSDNTNIENSIINKDEYGKVLKQLDQLNPDQKEAITLKYIQEMEYDEIGQIMNKSVNAIRILIYKGLTKLRLENEPETRKLALFAPMFFPSFIQSSNALIWGKINNLINLGTNTTMITTTTAVAGKAILSTLAAKAIAGVFIVATVAGAATYVIANNNSSKQTNIPAIVQQTTTPVISTTTQTLTVTPTTNDGIFNGEFINVNIPLFKNSSLYSIRELDENGGATPENAPYMPFINMQCSGADAKGLDYEIIDNVTKDRVVLSICRNVSQMSYAQWCKLAVTDIRACDTESLKPSTRFGITGVIGKYNGAIEPGSNSTGARYYSDNIEIYFKNNYVIYIEHRDLSEAYINEVLAHVTLKF